MERQEVTNTAAMPGINSRSSRTPSSGTRARRYIPAIIFRFWLTCIWPSRLQRPLLLWRRRRFGLDDFRLLKRIGLVAGGHVGSRLGRERGLELRRFRRVERNVGLGADQFVHRQHAQRRGVKPVGLRAGEVV